MGQLVESGRGSPDDSDLLCSDVAALSHRLPRQIPRKGIVDAALHDSAALASPVWNKRPHEAFFPRCYPLVREQTAHDHFPLG
jgi:hypothetical protein